MILFGNPWSILVYVESFLFGQELCEQWTQMFSVKRISCFIEVDLISLIQFNIESSIGIE